MAKRRIRLTEGQLFGLIEQALNELDIRTKASAFNKATDDWYKHRMASKDRSNNPLKREYAGKMANKRWKQLRAFQDSVENELKKDADDQVDYRTNSAYDPRGILYVKEPQIYGSNGRNATSNKNVPLEKMKEFLNGNAYYDEEKGWLEPGDDGYDVEKSEEWAQIRQKNEAVAHKITKNIIHTIKEGLKKSI